MGGVATGNGVDTPAVATRQRHLEGGAGVASQGVVDEPEHHEDAEQEETNVPFHWSSPLSKSVLVRGIPELASHLKKDKVRKSIHESISHSCYYFNVFIDCLLVF